MRRTAQHSPDPDDEAVRTTMCTIQVRLDVPAAELLDAGEDVQRLLERDEDACPALRRLLLALDDAITDGLREAPDELREPAAA